jgi:hypothetical protein
MPKVSLTTIKNWFKTGLKPTQTQFENTWDSFFHKDDTIPQASVDGLAAALTGLPSEEQLDQIDLLVTSVSVSTSGTIDIGAGRLVWKVVIIPGATETIKVGTTSGGDEIIERGVTAGTPYIINPDQYFESAGTLHFTGTFTVKVYQI